MTDIMQSILIKEVKGNRLDADKSEFMVVDFWAPWCGPCKMFSPIFENVANKFAGMDNPKICFAKVNVDENQDLAAEFEIQTIPTILFIKNGKVIDRKSGMYMEDKFVDLVKNTFNIAG